MKILFLSGILFNIPLLWAQAADANLLKSPSFESNRRVWKQEVWTNTGLQQKFDSTIRRSQGVSLKFKCTKPNDARMLQTIKVKPNTDYLLGGWIKTSDIQIEQQGGSRGAHIAIIETSSKTDSLKGDSDWQQVETIFNSGERTEITVAARLGDNGSVVVGEAWFDDLYLIEKHSFGKLFRLLPGNTTLKSRRIRANGEERRC